MKPCRRTYKSEEDYWRIRSFLRETFLLNDRRERNWPLYRFDYWRWHVNINLLHLPLNEAIYLWETVDDRIAAVLIQNEPGDAAMQIHPDWYGSELVCEMVDTAAERLAKTQEERSQALTIWVDSQDLPRQEILRDRGYEPGEWPEYQRYRSLDGEIPESTLPPGFCIRPLGTGLELLERCYASGLAFHPDEIEIALDNRKDFRWYTNIQNAPLYRRDLDLVVVAPDGEIAAFTTIWFDDVTRTGAFEPVGTIPAHQRRGLGKALMLEGLRRLACLGATRAAVSSYSARAGALYESAGFVDYDLSQPWTRTWTGNL